MTDVVTPFIQFYDAARPVLLAGERYSIVAEQSIDGLDTGDYFKPVTQSLEVRAAQFSLDASWVHARFPPPNSSGRFHENLPHIALDTPVLPWEREIVAGDTTSPWLALLVVRGGELAVDPTTGSALRRSTVSELLTPDATVVTPAIDPASVPGDVLASQCLSILVPGALFQAIVPVAR
jgi:hypothetical protein